LTIIIYLLLFFERLKEGEDFTMPDGSIIKNDLVTIANKPARSYAYCTDTLYTESIAQKVKDADLLYHEATYLKDLEKQAASRYHSTSVQAARLAQLAGVKKLLLGHFSSKYEKLDAFVTEASQVFSNVALALEGVTYLVQ